MRHSYLLLLTAGWFLLIGASPGAAQPEWVTQPPAGSSLHVYGVGIAHSTGDKAYDRQRADDVARTDIARQLRVTINARLTSTTAEDAEKGITQDTRQVIESSVSITLDGVDIKNRYYDKKSKTYYALARLNRQSAAERIGEKIQSAAGRAAGFLRLATRYHTEGATYRAFLVMLQAAEERASVEIEEGIYRALAANSVDALLEAEGASSRFSPTLPEVDRRISDLVTSLSFGETEGDRQQIDAGKVEHPLTARLVTEWEHTAVPAAGFPVCFTAKQGRARLDHRSATNKYGIASSMVYQAGTCGEAFSTIVAAVDTAAIRAQAPGNQVVRWISRLGEVSIRFTLLPGIFGFEDGIAELACRLSRNLRPENAIVVARFTYQDTRIAGPVTGPLRRVLNAELAAIGRGRIIEQINLTAGAAEYGDPNATETVALAVRADAVIWGNYREQGDSVVVHAQMTGTDGARLASASIVIPRDAIPYTIRPPILDPDLPKPPTNGIPIKIWTERGDGGLYVEGERFTAYVQSETDCYLRLLYRQVDGQVIQIFPNRLSGDERVTAGQVYAIPDIDDSYDFVINGPFGVEYLIAVASATPFPRLQGREINGGVLLHGTAKDAIQRLTEKRTRYGQAVCRMTTMGQ